MYFFDKLELLLDKIFWAGGGRVNEQLLFFSLGLPLKGKFSILLVIFWLVFFSLVFTELLTLFLCFNFFIIFLLLLLLILFCNIAKPLIIFSFSFFGIIFWPIVKWFIFIFILLVVFPPCITIQLLFIFLIISFSLSITFFSFFELELLLLLSFWLNSSINKLIEFVVWGIMSLFFNSEIIWLAFIWNLCSLEFIGVIL